MQVEAIHIGHAACERWRNRIRIRQRERTLVVLKIVELITPLRMEAQDEARGMDVSLHGEEGYVFED